jgi:phage-related protein
MAGWFFFNGLDTSNIDGLSITGQDTYTIATRKINHQAVSGRSGDLLTDNGGYGQVKVTYHCTIDASDDAAGINTIINTLAAALSTAKDYKELRDSYHPNTYRMAVLDKGIDFAALKPASGSPHKVANFDVVFSCKPQRFLDAGGTAVTVANGGTVNNPTAFPASPTLEISGTGTVNIGSQQITILSTCPASPVYIDCETMDAFSGAGANLNNYVSLPVADIVLDPGDNTITYSGVSSVSITPRSWLL